MDEQSQNLSESIIVGNCLSCHGLVRVPAKAPAKSRVRCPHCSESYALAQILNQAVPELELVEDLTVEPNIPVVDKVVIKEREKFVVPPQLSQGARRRSRRRSSSSPGSDWATDSEYSVNSPNKSDDDSRRSSGSSRSRSQSRSSSKSQRRRGGPSPVIELMKVVIGGLLAIPIAYLLVFWIFKQDPLNVGPTIGNVVPFLVPAELRGDKVEDAGEDSKKVKPKAPAAKTVDDNLADLPIPDVDPDLVKPPQ